MFWWHGRQRPDPTKPSCRALVALWGPSADRTWAIPWICQDDSPEQNTKPATARSAPRWRRADRQGAGELWLPIGGGPFSRNELSSPQTNSASGISDRQRDLHERVK